MPFLNPWFVSKLLLFLLSSGRKQGNRLKVVRSPNPHLYDHHRHHIITIFGRFGYISGKFFIFQTHYYAFRGLFQAVSLETKNCGGGSVKGCFYMGKWAFEMPKPKTSILRAFILKYNGSGHLRH